MTLVYSKGNFVTSSQRNKYTAVSDMMKTALSLGVTAPQRPLSNYVGIKIHCPQPLNSVGLSPCQNKFSEDGEGSCSRIPTANDSSIMRAEPPGTWSASLISTHGLGRGDLESLRVLSLLQLSLVGPDGRGGCSSSGHLELGPTKNVHSGHGPISPLYAKHRSSPHIPFIRKSKNDGWKIREVTPTWANLDLFSPQDHLLCHFKNKPWAFLVAQW